MITRDRTGAEVRSAIGVPDAMSLAEADALARQVAPLRPGTGGPADDPLSADTTLTSLLGHLQPVHVDCPALWRPRPPRARLRVPIGIDADGAAGRAGHQGVRAGRHGPARPGHRRNRLGQVRAAADAGAGPGLTHSSEVLNFVLVDFKGGATFLGLDELPHVSAVITNLADELPLVDRMRDALTASWSAGRSCCARPATTPRCATTPRPARTGADLPPCPRCSWSSTSSPSCCRPGRSSSTCSS